MSNQFPVWFQNDYQEFKELEEKLCLGIFFHYKKVLGKNEVKDLKICSDEETKMLFQKYPEGIPYKGMKTKSNCRLVIKTNQSFPTFLKENVQHNSTLETIYTANRKT